MGVVFAPQWLTHGDDQVLTQAKALTLIHNARNALADNKHMEIYNWILAANSAAPPVNGNFLRVFKGTHQEEGVFNQYVHLTMSLKIQKTSGEYNHASYGGAFHLYIEVLDPLPGSARYQLKPVAISYVSSQGTRYLHQIAAAALCDSDKA